MPYPMAVLAIASIIEWLRDCVIFQKNPLRPASDIAISYVMETKSSQIRQAIAQENWTLALRLASRLPQLGKHSADIKRAHECQSNPSFYRQLGRDLDALFEAGKIALVDRFVI